MRKLFVIAVAAVAVLAVAGIALAANEYELTKSSTFPAGKGTPSKPVPKGVSFDYTVKDEAGPRGKPVQKYRIGFQGLTTKYHDEFPQCKFGDTDDDAPRSTILQKCRKAVVGSGRIESLVVFDSKAADPTAIDFYCNFQLTLINIPGGLSIRLDADNTAPLPQSQDDKIGCLTPTHRAIHARYNKVKIGGVQSSSLDFTVLPELLHNSGFTITVARVQSRIDRLKTRVKIKGKRRSVGVFTAVGCAKRGNKRKVQVTFIDEEGDSRKASGSGKC